MRRSRATPGPSTSSAGDEDEWQTPNSLDATEPRLAEEADGDDWGICPSPGDDLTQFLNGLSAAPLAASAAPTASSSSWPLEVSDTPCVLNLPSRA